MRRRRGFSLIEVSVAILITTLVLVGSMAILVGALEQDKDSQARGRAIEIAQDQIDQARRMPLESVAVDTAAYAALDEAGQAAYAKGESGGETPIRADGGALAPTRTVDGFTVYSYVYCQESGNAECTSETGDPKGRRVTVVVEREGGAGRQGLTAEVNPSNLNLIGAIGGDTVAAPTNVQASQVAANALWFSWTRPAGATSYRVLAGDDLIGIAQYNGFAFTDARLTDEWAGRDLQFVVRAVGSNQAVGPPATVRLLTRPFLDTDGVVHSGAGNTLTWAPADMVADEVDGFTVERRRSSGSWLTISGASLLTTNTFVDPDGGCGDYYRVRVYASGALPGVGNVEGQQVATSSGVMPEQGVGGC